MARLLMKNASHIVTCDPSDTVYTDSNLLMEDGVITYIGPEEQQAEEVIDRMLLQASSLAERLGRIQIRHATEREIKSAIDACRRRLER